MNLNPFKRLRQRRPPARQRRLLAIINVLTQMGATFTDEEIRMLQSQEKDMWELEEKINLLYWRIGGLS